MSTSLDPSRVKKGVDITALAPKNRESRLRGDGLSCGHPLANADLSCLPRLPNAVYLAPPATVLEPRT